MEQVSQVKLSFRALRKAANGRKAGEARPALVVNYVRPTVGDAVADEAIGFVLETYIRGLVEDNSADWSYSPKVEDITLANWKAWNETVADRKREVTTATLAAFGKVYAELAQAVLGKSEAQAKVGEQVIAQRLVKVIGNRDICAALLGNMTAIVSGASVEQSELLESHDACFNWVVRMLEDAVKVEVTANSL